MTKPSVPGNTFSLLLQSARRTVFSLLIVSLALCAFGGPAAGAAADAKPAASAKKPAASAKKPVTRKSTTARKAPARKTTTAKKTSAPKRATAKKKATTARRARSSKRRVTARSARFKGQRTPTVDRYREIQVALSRAGFLETEPSGKWDEATAGAMKRFQQQHDLPSTGKVNALSLIALGLGPKRGPAPGSTSVLQSPPATIATESNDRE